MVTVPLLWTPFIVYGPGQVPIDKKISENDR